MPPVWSSWAFCNGAATELIVRRFHLVEAGGNMANEEPAVWGIHAGRTGDANQLFLKRNRIAIGWDKVGNLGNLGKDRESFKEALIKAYPETRPGAIAGNAGQLYRFTHEMKIGDFVAYPSKSDRHIHVGTIQGDYMHDPATEPGYPNQRAVKWLASMPRTSFSQGALYEIGSAMSFFRIKSYAEEFINSAVGKKLPIDLETDSTIAPLAENIEETTQDWILKKLETELKGHPLAEFVAHLLNKMGYQTRISPEGPDGGIDILAHKDELGFVPPIVKVQVKSGIGSVGDPIVSALYGKVTTGEYGLLVTLGTFTNQARNFARSKSNLRLIDGTELVEMILQHYDQFDSQYKGMLPLKRVFVPQPLEEE
jgi:restriction system protein